jgi:hypothetical protein
MTAANIRIGAGPSGADALVGSPIAWLVCSNNSSTLGSQQFTMEQYYKQLCAPMGTVLVNTTTLDPATTFATLSNGNLTAFDSVNGNLNARSTTSHSSGLIYFETTVKTAANSSSAVGIGNGSLGHSSFVYPGRDLNGIGYLADGTVRINAATITTLATYTSGSIIGIAVDLTHNKIWFGLISGSTISWNNDVLANQNPATNTGGISLSTLNAGPYFAVVSPAAFGDTMIANFGGSAYTNATLLPSGFGNW